MTTTIPGPNLTIDDLYQKVVAQKKKYPGVMTKHALQAVRFDSTAYYPETKSVPNTGNVVELVNAINGYTIRIEYDYDYYPDYSHLGEFSDTWADGALALHDGDTYTPWKRDTARYFIPEYTYAQRRHDLGRDHSRGVADFLARKYVREDYLAAKEYTSYSVTVTAVLAGRDVGDATLGGIEEARDGWGFDTDQAVKLATDDGLIDEAMIGADQWLQDAYPDTIKLVSAVLEWAKTPGPHGGNPYTHEFVRIAERINDATT